MIYLFIFVYTLILSYYYDVKGRKRGFEFHFWVLLLVMILVPGLSYRLGIDVIRYELAFNWYLPNFEDYHFFNSQMFVAGQEPIWLFLNVYVKHFLGEFFYVKLIVAIFVNGTIFWFLRKHSPAFFFSILLYFAFPFFAFNFQVLRESLAVSFFLIALDNIIDGKNDFVKYYLWLIPAIFCHHYAFLTLLVPLVFYLKPNLSFVIICIFVLVASPFINNLMNMFIGMDFFDEGIADSMEGYLNSEKYARSNLVLLSFINNLILNLVPFVLLLAYYKNRDSRYMGLALSYLLLKLMNIVVVGLFYRFTNYLIVPMIVVLSSSFHEIECKGNLSHVRITLMKNKTIARLIVAYLIICGVYTKVASALWPMYYPYASVITRNTDAERGLLDLSIPE